MMRATVLITALLSLTPLAGAAEPGEGTAIRRFALVASSNDGGPGRPHLRFANSDGDSMGHVLANLGGVHAEDIVSVRDATRARLLQAFTTLKAEIARERRPLVRREVFVYYSGHSDEEGLLLGGESVGYRELRQWIDGLGADVRIAILDSCASGTLIRLKGGVHRMPFLSDVSTQARGHAFLTASSAAEAAQESDRVGAAFFTHYLLSGMRGAADANHDQRVTLNEAYQFAYNETLQRTETSRAGAQHPAYDIQLAGTGDLVMTDLHASGARLVLRRDLVGRIYVRDAGDRLLVELHKEPNYPVELGLEPGVYHVVIDKDGQISEGTINLARDGRVELSPDQLKPVVPMVSVLRGSEGGPTLGPAGPVVWPRHYRHVGFDLVLAPGFRLSGNTGEPVEHNFILGVVGHSDSLRGMQLSLAGNIVQDKAVGVQLGGAFALSYGPLAGAQLSSFNLALAGLRGVQLGWVANVARGPVRGAQVSFINIADRSLHGAQVGLVNLERGDTEGAQVGLVNLEKGDMAGAQVGLINVDKPTRTSTAAQVGLVNVTAGSGERSAASVGLVNVVQKQRGTQIGLVNVADEVDGVQIGLVSFARKNNGASIALLPIVLDGDNRLTLGWNNISALNVGFKLGTRWVYVAGAVGMTRDIDADGHREYTSGFGIGVHAIPRGGRFYLDVDASNTNFTVLSDSHTGRTVKLNTDYSKQRWLQSLRIQAGYAIATHLAVVAGPTLNVQEAKGDDDRRPRNVNFAEQVWTSGKTTVRMFPDFAAGLEF